MAWLAVDQDCTECIFLYKPKRNTTYWSWHEREICLNLPEGSIEKLTGEKITWEDEPIELC